MLISKYNGGDSSLEDCDQIAIHIHSKSKKCLDIEPELFKTKWFEYRHLHPTKATFLYAHHYQKAYKRHFGIIFDKNRANNVLGTKKDPVLNKGAISFWKGRVASDKLGIPYDFYISQGMSFLINEVKWKRIPRPSQLYDEAVIEEIDSRWKQKLRHTATMPLICHLSNDNVFCTQTKQEVERWLCERLQTRRNAHLMLSDYIYEKKIVSETIALEFFSSEELQKAKDFFEE